MMLAPLLLLVGYLLIRASLYAKTAPQALFALCAGGISALLGMAALMQHFKLLSW